jgi:cell division protein FtsQ
MKRADQLKVYDMVLSEMDKPLLLVDLEGIQTKLESYGWFKEVTVSRRLPETLVVTIVERKPTAVWQRGGKLSLLDDEGNVLDNIDASKMGQFASNQWRQCQ